MRHVVSLMVVLCLAAGSVSAATFITPSDAELLGRAQLVVIGTVLDSAARESSDRMIYTDSRLRIEEVIRGQAPSTLTVTELGGFANGHGVAVSGSATYVPGTRVMAFLRQRDDGSYFTAYMALGKYRFTERDGIRILVRDADGVEVDDDSAFAARPATEFVEYIREGAPAAAKRPMQLEAHAATDSTPVTEASASTFCLTDPLPLRWNCPSACTKSWTVGAPQQGSVDTPEAVQDAMAAWTGETFAWITLNISGLNNHTGHTNDDVNDIIFNSTDTAGVCDSGIGCGLVYHNAVQHTFDGSTFISIVSSDVIIRPVNFSQAAFEGVLTHELGHGIGFKHAPASGKVMSQSPASGATLRDYDREAVAEVYGNGLPCAAPAITSTSGAGTIFSGKTKTLSVTAGGTAPFTYQWYQGNSGNTSNPIVGATNSSYTTPALTSTTSYWARVGSCTPALTTDSTTITVTVEPCPTPQITTQPENKNIQPNTTATLTVAATNGSPFTYQWYRGSSGDTSNAIGGATSNSYTTPMLQTTTNYWVRVTNTCGLVALSNTATVQVVQGCSPSFTSQPASQTISTGATATMTVTTSSATAVTYQWFQGNVGDTTNLIAGANAASFTTPALQVSTSYWVRATNNCGSTSSAQAVITVEGPNCEPLAITSLPSTVDIEVGDGITIVVTATGTGRTYQWYQGESPNTATPVAGATDSVLLLDPFLTIGTFRYWVQVKDSCQHTVNSATVVIQVSCGTPDIPLISAPSISHYTSGYDVSWIANGAQTPTYELQEARDAGFTIGLTTFIVNGAQKHIEPHLEILTDTRFFYRVRGIAACTQLPTAYSATTTTVVTRPQSQNNSEFSISVPDGTTQTFTQPYLVPGFGATATGGDTFAITTDAPWLTVFPPSGALSAGGTTVEFTINPALIEIGSSTATVAITRTQPSSVRGGIATNGTTGLTLPFTVSKVTPVTPAPRDPNAPEGTLVVPAIAHADGIGTRFQSDVRIVNASGSPIDYELSFTPSQTNGTQVGKQLPLTIAANETKGLDDLVKAWFGAGLLGEAGLGTLEIRPLGGANPLATFASSRTYAIDSNSVSDNANCQIVRCTLGQFIPALGLDKFISNLGNDPLNRISMQQLSNSIDSSGFRTNLGFVEGSGSQATMRLTLRDGLNNVLKQVERSIPPYGHEQTSLSAIFGPTALTDGRVEVEVISAGGKVSSYASVVDNATADPLLVFPVQAQKVSAQHYVVPGVAEINNGPASNFHTDMRVYNAAAIPQTVALSYFPGFGASRPANVNITLQPGEVLAINNVIPSLWQLTATGGAVAVDAPGNASLVVTARTFSRNEDGGTFGQFIPGVTAADGVGLGQRALEVLQLEQSDQYRTNLGLVEVTGNPVTVEILGQTGNKLTARTEATLNPNEFRQIGLIFQQLGFTGASYQGRVSVRVIGGNGRVAAYGSVVDNRTIDPTYVPAQRNSPFLDGHGRAIHEPPTLQPTRRQCHGLLRTIPHLANDVCLARPGGQHQAQLGGAEDGERERDAPLIETRHEDFTGDAIL